jgi:hypothetical protein
VRIVKLSDLPQFSVVSRQRAERGLVLRGRFNHLDTVREGRSWLYVSGDHSLIGDLEGLDPETREAVFITPDELPEDMSILPWLDGWWQAYQIALILDPDHIWHRVVFKATDAFASRKPGWVNLRPAVGEDPGRGEQRVPAAWDHEHCMLCDAHIDPGGEGYVDDAQNWLCPACHDAYAKPHDLSFVRGDA